MKASEMLAMPAATAEPMVVYTGPKRDGAALVAAVAADEASQTVRGKKRKGKGRVTVRIAAKPDPKADAASRMPSRRQSPPPKPAAARSRPRTNTAASPKPAAAAAKPAPAKDAAEEGRRENRRHQAASPPPRTPRPEALPRPSHAGN